MAVSVKISEENYRKLSALSGRLREEQGRPVSLNEALDYLQKKESGSLLELAGAWNMTDKEVKTMFANLRKDWDRWNKRYA